MGAEDFLVRNSCDVDVGDVKERLRHVGFIEDEKRRVLSDEVYLTYENSEHIIEAELRGHRSRCDVMLRFAVCHPESINAVYISIVRQVANLTNGKVQIADELDPMDRAHNGVFLPPDWHGMDETMVRSIRLKRDLWIADFGSATAKATCDEALERFVIRPFSR